MEVHNSIGGSASSNGRPAISHGRPNAWIIDTRTYGFLKKMDNLSRYLWSVLSRMGVC